MDEAGRTPSRFERHPRLTLALALSVVLAALEGALRAGYALWGGGYDADKAALLRADGIDDVGLFWSELERLSKDRAQYHPYRWYALPPSVLGRYHATDAAGFRNGPLSPGSAKVALFGGSTAYSVLTTADNSIPGLLNRTFDRARREAVNYGIGGYGSTCELATFIEVTRRPDHGIRWAVFLDGVNEASRYAERWQDQASAPFYDSMGYRWAGALYALSNEIGVPVRSRTALGRAFEWVGERAQRLARARRVSRAPEDYRRAGLAAADIYFHNLADIRALARAKGVTPIFILQPTLFELRNPTARERALRARASEQAIDIGQLYAATYRAVREDPRFAELGVHDL